MRRRATAGLAGSQRSSARGAAGGALSAGAVAIIKTIRELVNARVEPIYAPPRPGDVKDSQADISKASRVLGYAPIVSFEEGLARTVAWYRDSQVTVA